MEGSPFKKIQEKLKKVKIALSTWSKSIFGDMFKKIATMEDVIKMKELQLELNPTKENRAELRKVVAELRRFQTYEEDY